jgi:hypothetical protein
VTVYKIRRSDGLFSAGGCSPKFTPKGKAWSGTGPLKNHLNQLSKAEIKKYYGECVIVQFIISTEEGGAISVEEFYDP